MAYYFFKNPVLLLKALAHLACSDGKDASMLDYNQSIISYYYQSE